MQNGQNGTAHDAPWTSEGRGRVWVRWVTSFILTTEIPILLVLWLRTYPRTASWQQ